MRASANSEAILGKLRHEVCSERDLLGKEVNFVGGVIVAEICVQLIFY